MTYLTSDHVDPVHGRTLEWRTTKAGSIHSDACRFANALRATGLSKAEAMRRGWQMAKSARAALTAKPDGETLLEWGGGRFVAGPAPK